MSKRVLNVVLAKPRGFCAGVERAIEIVERALKKYGAPVYVRHEIVHNKYVVEDLRRKGAVFVDEVTDVPVGAIAIFSAHGVAEKVENDAKLRDLEVIDATCPLVRKVHKEAQKHEEKGREIILIGHEGHPEVEGTSGRVKSKVILVQSVEDVSKISVQNPKKLSYVTQTTLSVDDTRNIINALKERFPMIEGPDLRDICYATQNRQDAVRKLAQEVDVILVIGSHNSSNSNRLRDLGEEIGKPSYLINGGEDIDSSWFDGKTKVGITAGASAPEILLEKVLGRLEEIANITVKTQDTGLNENVKFKLPEELVGVA
ncbi:MAG: hydroxymethylbutenyl pyrophosphate reductase [Candidatus Midichloriaceae bacterium]|jgi:4-hydroxy-3-methylbut-2-enyl diphosphate reductase|nr:hydroxymethylbutenyl pyrophosphate reductase [Candidatus Midichloriaceae bacterium]